MIIEIRYTNGVMIEYLADSILYQAAHLVIYPVNEAGDKLEIVSLLISGIEKMNIEMA